MSLQSKPLSCGFTVGCYEFHADIVASEQSSGYEGRTGTAKRVKDDSIGFTERLNEGFERIDGFLCRVEAVAGIGPVDHIGNRQSGRNGIPLDQEVSHFVLVPEKPRR